MPRETTTEASLSDAPENANEEFGRGDQEFGGGAGEVEYGEAAANIGSDGIVAERNFGGRQAVPVMDDEREGVALPGSDPEDLVARDEGLDLARHDAATRADGLAADGTDDAPDDDLLEDDA